MLSILGATVTPEDGQQLAVRNVGSQRSHSLYLFPLQSTYQLRSVRLQT